MIDIWLARLEDLILSAPAWSDDDYGVSYQSTLDRLGETDPETAKANRVFYDYLETDDAAAARPFFVLAEAEVDWYRQGFDSVYPHGVIEMAYTEQVRNIDDPSQPVTGADLKASKAEFMGWVAGMIQSALANRGNCNLPISGVTMANPAQRPPRKNRDLIVPGSDYWWCSWLWFIGERS